MTSEPYGDALSRPYWEAALRSQLLIQRCTGCGAHQFYPRPFCLRCDGTVEWVAARGTGRVYSRTTVRIPAGGDLEVPYVAAIVELDEGPRMLTTLTDLDLPIGAPVRVSWRARAEGAPTPVFGPA